MTALVMPSRRQFLRALTASFAGVGMSPWFPAFADSIGTQRSPRRCILLWMTGGPSQLDTFDLKPGHTNGGPFKEIATSAAGLRFSEHLPRLARQAQHLCVLRGLSTTEGDHGRATYLLRTGRSPASEVYAPTLGSLISKELANDELALPSFVSVNPHAEFNPDAYSAGFLGPRYASLNVKPKSPTPEGFTQLGVDHLHPPAGVAPSSAAARLKLLNALQARLLARNPDGPASAHDATLQRAVRLMNSSAGKVFDLSDEPATVREKYGRGSFGQGCLLARRLVESGAKFVEVSLGEQGQWDTHTQNFPSVQRLSAELDAGWSSLMEELNERGLLESTTILWMGEFGRTPQINGAAGRDHYPRAWTAVLAGGGIQGGQAYGRTSPDGSTVSAGKIGVGDLLATLCAALNINHRRQNISEIGRPLRIAEGKPIDLILL